MKWEKGFYSKWKNCKWEEYDRDEILKFCIPCRKYEKEGRLVIETRNFRVDAIKQREARKFHILIEDWFNIDCLKENSSTVVCSYTGEVELGPS